MEGTWKYVVAFVLALILFFFVLGQFVRLAEGATDQGWSPWFVKKGNLSREQFARAIEANDQKILRVSAKEFAEVWGNQGLPVPPDLAGAATFLRSSEVSEVPCTSELINQLHLARVNTRTGVVDFNYVRLGCYAGEKFLAWKGQVFVSLGCGNPAQERKQVTEVPPRQLLPTPPVAGTVPPDCPEVYTLKVNVWSPVALKFPGVEQAIAAAESSKDDEGFRDASRLSRKLGGALRAEAARNSSFQRSATPRLFRMSLIRVDKDDRVLAEQPLGDYMVTGLREFKFTRAQLAWDAIRILDLREEMVSPVFHPRSSLREIRFYNTRIFRNLEMGEWDTNPVPDCVMNVHAIEQKAENLPVGFPPTQ